MSQRIENSEIGIVIEYSRSFSPQASYKTNSDASIIETTSNPNFIGSRVILMADFLTKDKNGHFEMSQSYLAEQLVRLAIKNPLEERGFFLDLAPQSLEHGNNQKGVDLIVIDSNQTICLGIDLKLKKSKHKSAHDGFGWCENTLSPFIYLKMGDWSLSTREESDVDIRQWIQKYTCPKLKTTGKIPRIYELRQYIIPRITKTIEKYIEVIANPKDEFDQSCIPENRQSLDLLNHKLTILHSLFSEISSDYHISSQNPPLAEGEGVEPSCHF